MSTLHLPYIIERSSRGERTYDIYSRLLMDRIIFLGSQINDDVANIVIAQLLFLEADCAGQGHSALHQLSWWRRLGRAGDLRHDAASVVVRCARSVWAWRRAWGAFSLRRAAPASEARLPHARIMMHQPWGGTAKGTASDIEIAAKEILYMRAKMFELLGKHTGQPLERIEREFDRDHYMSAEEAKTVRDHRPRRRADDRSPRRRRV